MASRIRVAALRCRDTLEQLPSEMLNQLVEGLREVIASIAIQ